MNNKALKEKLLSSRKNGFDRDGRGGAGAAWKPTARNIWRFWTQARPSGSAPRRQCAWQRQAGYKPLVRGQALKAGDKVYVCNRGKSVLLAHIGEQVP